MYSPAWGGYVLWIGPGALIYKFGGYILAWFWPGGPKEAAKESTPEELKRLAKKEKNKDRVKYVKH